MPIPASAHHALDSYAITGGPGSLHLSISDASGDSAIFENIDGKLAIQPGKQYNVIINSANFHDQRAFGLTGA